MADAQVELAVDQAIQAAMPDPELALHLPDLHPARLRGHHGFAKHPEKLLEIFVSHGGPAPYCTGFSACRLPSIAMLTLTSSPSTLPPASSTRFQTIP